MFEPPKIVCSRGRVVITIYDLKLLGVTKDEVATFEIIHRNSEVKNLFGELGVRVNLKKGDILEKLAGSALDNCPELGAMKVTDVHYDETNQNNC